jgi:hypothetical protein
LDAVTVGVPVAWLVDVADTDGVPDIVFVRVPDTLVEPVCVVLRVAVGGAVGLRVAVTVGRFVPVGVLKGVPEGERVLVLVIVRLIVLEGVDVRVPEFDGVLVGVARELGV